VPTILRYAALAIALVVLTMAPLESRAAAPDAVVTEVRTSGSAGSYTFDVTIKSNDTGCGHYVDWWEVVDENGGLVYRRVLLHDHADEQPFTRDGGPANVKAGQVVTVRAHVNTSGYSSAAMRGSAQGGFKSVDLPAGYAAALAKKPPLPEVC
jgi:hypothetical protein